MRPIMAKAINYMKPDIDPNTRLYVPFNEGVGDLAKDYSQYCNHAQLTDVEWSNEGFNGAGKFNGSSSFGNCGNNESLDITKEITIEMWAETSVNWGAYDAIVAKAEDGSIDEGYGIYLHETDIHFYVTHYTNNVAYSPFSADGNLHYIVGTYDENNLRNYVDATEGTSDSYTGPITVANTALTIGRLSTGYVGAYFNGAIDNVIISSTARSPAQIAADCYEVVCS